MSQLDGFGDPKRVVEEACAKDGIGVMETFLRLVAAAWDGADRDLRLRERLGNRWSGVPARRRGPLLACVLI